MRHNSEIQMETIRGGLTEEESSRPIRKTECVDMSFQSTEIKSGFTLRETSTKRKDTQYHRSQADHRKSNATTYFKSTAATATANIESVEQIVEIKEHYDPSDMTYTLIEGKINLTFTGIMFLTFTALRYYTLGCCIYISSNSQHLEWLIPFLLVRVIFLCVVIKISVSVAQGRTQVILKTHWNSMTYDGHEYFQVLSPKKLILSIVRGFIPSELSFIYINSENRRKRYEIFTSINFIFVSIEMVVFYPFFIIYCIILTVDDTFSLNIYYKSITILLVAGGYLLFIISAIYLVIKGVKTKYGSFRNFLRYKKQGRNSAKFRQNHFQKYLF